MQWTIIRPGGLKSEPATGSGILTEDRSICGAINREDVAELVVKALFSDKSDGKVGHPLQLLLMSAHTRGRLLMLDCHHTLLQMLRGSA